MSSGLYNSFKAELLSGVHDLTAASSVYVALMTTGHSFSAANATWADVVANEVANGAGYSSSGTALSSQTITTGAAALFDAGNVSWSDSTIKAGHAVLYNVLTGGNLVGSIDFGGEQETNSGTFTIQWHSSGVVTLT